MRRAQVSPWLRSQRASRRERTLRSLPARPWASGVSPLRRCSRAGAAGAAGAGDRHGVGAPARVVPQPTRARSCRRRPVVVRRRGRRRRLERGLSARRDRCAGHSCPGRVRRVRRGAVLRADGRRPAHRTPRWATIARCGFDGGRRRLAFSSSRPLRRGRRWSVSVWSAAAALWWWPVAFATSGRVPGVPPARGVATAAGIAYVGWGVGPPAVGALAAAVGLRGALVLPAAVSAIGALVVHRVRRGACDTGSSEAAPAPRRPRPPGSAGARDVDGSPGVPRGPDLPSLLRPTDR